MIDLDGRLEKLFPEDVLIGRPRSQYAAIDGFYLLAGSRELLFESDGEETLGVYLATFNERVADEQNSVLVVSRFAISVVKSKIVYLNPVLVLFIVHETHVGFEFQNLVVVSLDVVRVAQMKDPYYYFAEQEADRDADKYED